MEDIWETHKEDIRRLYIVEDKTCQQVAAEMKAEYGFEAKASQYQRHFEKWKFRKNLSEGEWKFISRRIQKRKAEQNKESELRINGFVIHQKKIEKALSRYSETTLERAQRQATSRRSCTPEGIAIATPPRHEPVIPLSFPVYVENLPFLRFQQILVREAPVFDQLLPSFRRLSIEESYSRIDSIISNTQTSSQISSSAPLSALLDMAWDSSRLTDAYPTITPSFLKKFITVLLELVNNSARFRPMQAHVAELLLESLQFSEGKAMTLKLLGEQSPVFETLVELLFKYALSKCNVELIEFLLQHSHVGPNDMLRSEEFSPFLPIVFHPRFDKIMRFGGAITPIEYAIAHRSSSLLRALRQYGATLDIQGRRVRDMLIRIPKYSLNEVISFMLDEGLMGIIDGSAILGDEFHAFLSRRIFGEAVQVVQHLPTEEPPTEEPFSEELPAEERIAEEQPTEELLEWSVRGEKMTLEELFEWSFPDEKMTLEESLLEQRTTSTEETFLHAIQCGNLHAVNRALDAGTDVNTVSALGNVPLKIAAERGDLPMVQSLLHHGAEVEPETSCSPIFWSIPSHEIIKLLLKKGLNTLVLDHEGVIPLCHFLLRHDPDTAMLLIDWGVCLGRHPKRTPLWVPTPLQIASSKGYDAVVEKLLDRNVDVNEEAPLHGHNISNRPEVQAFYGDTALAGAIRNSRGSRTHIINRLISKGANPNVVSRYGDTPLSIAIDHGDETAVQSLLMAGASLVDPEAFRAAAASGDIDLLRQSLKDGLCLDDIGTSALSSAVHSYRTNPDIKMKIVSFLIDSGARASGMKLMHQFIKEKSELAQLLLSHGACSAVLSHRARSDILSHRAHSAEFELSADIFERYWISKACENIPKVVEALRALLSMTSCRGNLTMSCFLFQQLITAARSGNFSMARAHIDAGIEVASVRTDLVMETAYGDSKNLAAVLFSPRTTPPDWLPKTRPEKCSPEEPLWKDASYKLWQDLMATGTELRTTANTQNESNSAVPLREFMDEGFQTSSLPENTYGMGSSKDMPLSSSHELDQYWSKVSNADIIESDPDRYHIRKVASKLLLGAAIEGGPAIIELLREAGLDINGEASGPKLDDFMKLRRTALQYAIQNQNYASADALIQAGADINAPANAYRGLTALQAAAIRGHIGIACKLLEKGAEVNAPRGSFEGRTALEGAAEWGRLDMVQLLLDNGADITDSAFREAQYRNSTKLAKDEGYPAIARLIKRHRLSIGYSDLSFDDSV